MSVHVFVCVVCVSYVPSLNLTAKCLALVLTAWLV